MPDPILDADSATALAQAMDRMAATPDSTSARMAFHAELSSAEGFVLLEAEVAGGTLRPRVFELSDARAVLGFDTEMRLAEFAGVAAAYAAVPGRVLVAMLAAAPDGLSLLVNADDPHAALLLPESLVWLATTLAAPAPAESHAVPDRFTAHSLPPAVLDLLVPALERRLSGLPGLSRAVLAGVHWRGGGQGHVLALSGLADAAQPPVARAMAEALALSGLEAGALDVVFPPDAAMARLSAVGLLLSPAPYAPPVEQTVTAGENPGLDPTRPPRLR